MTLDELLSEAAKVALAEREDYVWYEARGGKWTVKRGGYHGTISAELLDSAIACQLWIERRVLQTVFGWLTKNIHETNIYGNGTAYQWAPGIFAMLLEDQP